MTRSLCVLSAALMLALACAFSAPAADKGHVDLRSMSRTMAFAAVYDMQDNPGTYVGRLVRMNGSFATFEVRPGEKRHRLRHQGRRRLLRRRTGVQPR